MKLAYHRLPSVTIGWHRTQGRAPAFLLLWITLFSCGQFGSLPAAAENASPETGCQWALLIGVQKYHRAPQLRHTVNDVAQLAVTLRTRGGFADDHILEMTDQVANPRYQPLKASMQAEVPKWLGQVQSEDSILVYFSGHGFRKQDDKMYLAPIDCDPADLAATGISVQWLRDRLAECKAKFKFLVLDACHAGSEKGADDGTGISGDDIGQPFKDLKGVVTLASSTAEEKSQIWEARQQSLFSYWFNQGLRGHADTSNDGAVDIDELYKYVYRHVTRSAKQCFPMAQNPVRIVRPGTVDVPVVVQLQPLSLRQVLMDMAEQIAIAMEEQQLRKVGVLEFTEYTRVGELLGKDFGLLGRYCAEELERLLIEAGSDQYQVANRRQLQSALADLGFTLDDLGSADALRDLSRQGGGMPVVALGTFRSRAGKVVNLQCKLIRTDSDQLAGSVGGVAVLSPNEWAMIGRSVAVKPTDYRRPAQRPGRPEVPQDEPLIEKWDERAEEPHPLLDRSFPFRIKIMIGGKERKPVFRGNDCFVPVRKGEVYEIWVENRRGQTVLMRLLVDGLNTLPEKVTTKGVTTQIVGKRVSLDEARHWILDPERAKVFAVRGFVSEIGIQGKLREFVVVDADESLAARRKFTDQIGLITAAFYAPAGSTRRVGTGLGAERDEEILKGKKKKPGNLLGVVHIRYVEAEALE